MGVEEEGALSKHREEQRVVPAAWGRERETVLSRRKVLSLFCVMRSLVINLLDLHGIKLALAGESSIRHPRPRHSTATTGMTFCVLSYGRT